MKKPLPTVLLVYTASVLTLFIAGYVSGGEGAVPVQSTISLLLLSLLALYLFTLRGRSAPPQGVVASSNPLLLFTLAMAARSIFIGFFTFPSEKVPVILLVILTNLLVEGRSLSAIGLTRVTVGRAATLGVLVGLAFYYLSWLVTSPIPYLEYASAGMGGWLPDVHDQVWILVNAFLFAALSEEVLFRGYIQGRLEGSVGPSRALLYSASLFGVWHTAWGIPYINTPEYALTFALSYLLFSGLAGVVFGELYRSTKSIIPPILAHGLWNTLSNIRPAYRLSPPTSSQGVLELLGFGLVVGALYLLIPRLSAFLKIEGAVKG